MSNPIKHHNLSLSTDQSNIGDILIPNLSNQKTLEKTPSIRDSYVEKESSYWDVFTDFEISLWQRAFAGAALPVAGVLSLAACNFQEDAEDYVLDESHQRLDNFAHRPNTYHGTNIPAQDNIFIGADVRTNVLSDVNHLDLGRHCMAVFGDEVIDYSQAVSDDGEVTGSIDPECPYSYLKMDTGNRFIFLCKDDCPYPAEYLEGRFNDIKESFDRLEGFLGIDVSSLPSAPFEVHLTLGGVCGDESCNCISPNSSTSNGRGKVCIPEYEQVLRGIDADTPKSRHELAMATLEARVGTPHFMVGHEAYHIVSGTFMDLPYMVDEMCAKFIEGVVSSGQANIYNESLNRRSFYTDGLVHGLGERALQIGYDLYNIYGFDFNVHFPTLLHRVREKKEQLGIEVPLPFPFVVDLMNNVICRDRGAIACRTSLDIFNLFRGIGIDSDLNLPYIAEGKPDLWVKDISLKPGGISVEICNLGPVGTEDSPRSYFDDLRHYNGMFNSILMVDGAMYNNFRMSTLGAYECQRVREVSFEEMDINPDDLEFIDVRAMVDPLLPTQDDVLIERGVSEIDFIDEADEGNNVLDQRLFFESSGHDFRVDNIYSPTYISGSRDRPGYIYADVCTEGPQTGSFSYRWFVNGVMVLEGEHLMGGLDNCFYPSLIYPYQACGEDGHTPENPCEVDEGTSPEVRFEVNSDRETAEINYDNNSLTVQYELPFRGANL